MTFQKLFSGAIRSVLANKLRTGLTMLGVIIGVASVIAMLALGNGVRAAVDTTFQFLGADLIQLTQAYSMQDGSYEPMGQKLTYQDGLALLDEIPTIKRIEMSASKTVRLRNGRVTLDLSASGVTSGSLENMVSHENLQPVDWPDGKKMTGEDFIGQGRFFNATEVQEAAPVCVLGYQTALDLFFGDNPIGQTIWVGRKHCEVIGVLVKLENPSSSQKEQSRTNQSLLMPISVMIMEYFDEEPSVNINAHAADSKQIDEVKEQIIELLRKRHAIEVDEEGQYQDDFSVLTRKDILGKQQETAKTFSLLLMVMAIISLVVGGIGIMNVMMVSVSERTREIGIRMALGATSEDIIRQFLIESIMISFSGGLGGIVVGVLFIPAAASLNQGMALLLPGSIPLSLGVSLFTGILFGSYPAYKASRLDPIEALRYE